MYNLLIVEDEKYARNHIKKYVKNNLSEYYSVFDAKNAEEALSYIKENEIDVVVTDIRMPGMSGIELAKILHEEYSSIIVMIISGYEEFEYAKSAMQYNVKEYFVKPFDLCEFRNILTETAHKLDEKNEMDGFDFYHENGFVKNNFDIQKEDKLQQTIALAIKYIEENYHKNISREDVAKAVFFSPVYFAKNFKTYTGMNFNDYLIKVRIEKSIELMQQNKYRIYEIAKKVGYENTKYFFRVFKLYTGYTPKDYMIKYMGYDVEAGVKKEQNEED